MMLSRIHMVLIIDMVMKIRKAILKLSSVIFFWQPKRSAAMSSLNWLKKFIFGWREITVYLDFDVIFKWIFELGMLHTFVSFKWFLKSSASI